ncbi:hypothetical protein KEJ15_08930, partial [Candidatus Bathyarchaeota archaeon]|nr:hypothetical protein [Candidatus Bathyarchaeota archaeon]
MAEAEAPNKDQKQEQEKATLQSFNSIISPLGQPQPKNDTTYITDPSNVRSNNLACPKCGLQRLWRDAKRYTKRGIEIQRWFCRDCGRRFCDPEDAARARNTFEHDEMIESKPLKSEDAIIVNSQICVTETKNLAAEPQKSRFLRRNET